MGFDIAEERNKKQKKIEETPIFRPGEVFTRDGSPNTPEPRVYGKYICCQCGHDGRQKTFTKGSIVVELFAWIFGLAFCWFFLISMILPIGYSMWRHLSRFKGCPSCHGTMIKTDSPIGQSMVRRLESDRQPA